MDFNPVERMIFQNFVLQKIFQNRNLELEGKVVNFTIGFSIEAQYLKEG